MNGPKESASRLTEITFLGVLSFRLWRKKFFGMLTKLRMNPGVKNNLFLSLEKIALNSVNKPKLL
jgi:hypothetical protein